MTLRASFSPFELVKNGKGSWVSFRHFHTLDKNEMTLEFLFVVFTLRIKHWNDGRVLFSFFALRIKIEKRYRVYSTLRPYSLNLLAKQRRVFFVTPYSQNNGTTRAIFDFFTLVKFRAPLLAAEEIVCSDNVFALSGTGRLYSKWREFTFRSFSDS